MQISVLYFNVLNMVLFTLSKQKLFNQIGFNSGHHGTTLMGNWETKWD